MEDYDITQGSPEGGEDPGYAVYDPYQEYVRTRVYQSEHPEEAPKRRAYSRSRHDLSETPAIVKAAFGLSLFSLILCVFSGSIYLALGCAIMGLATAIISKYYNNPERRLHRRAKTAIILSCISIVIVAFLLVFVFAIYPMLMSDPAFQELMRETLEQYGYTPPDPAGQPGLPLPETPGLDDNIV